MSVVTTLNAIRKTATSAYQSTVPLATMDNITDIGEIVLNSPETIKNEFIDALVNKIGLSLINSKEFGNPLMGLRKGHLEFGQTIEDIFVEMAEPHQYITGTRDGETPPDQYEINKAITQTAFYSSILGRQYFKTIHDQDLKRAFQSGNGLNSFISAIMQAIKNGENYDDYRMTISTLARQIQATEGATNYKGNIHLLTDYNDLNGTTLTVDEALDSKDFLTYMSNQFKKWSNRLTKPRRDLNFSGVTNWIPKESQRMLMLSDVQADIDTNLMAWAYNSERLAIGSVDEIDAWYSIGADSTATPVVKPDDITIKGDLGLTGNTPVVGLIYDTDMVKIYSKTRLMDTARNARGHYYNVFSTFEDIFACSPFHNFVVFFLD